jgi:hypothetical protein
MIRSCASDQRGRCGDSVARRCRELGRGVALDARHVPLRPAADGDTLPAYGDDVPLDSVDTQRHPEARCDDGHIYSW